MSKTDENLETLRYEDIFSLVLFALYRLRDDQQFSTLSEMAYIMDKQTLLNFLEYFGGSNIKVPTLADLRLMVNALLIYEMVDLRGHRFDESIKLLNLETEKAGELLDAYKTVKEVIRNYSFRRD